MTLLTRSNYEDYLVLLYFGSNDDYLATCIDRAYLDFSRTLHGIGSGDGKAQEEARTALRSAIESLRNGKSTVDSQEAFDDWHKNICQTLATVFRKYGYEHFFVGQAQKWINMTLKYIFTMGEERVQGFAGLYGYCHVPIDNIILNALMEHGFPGLPCSWSRLDDYDLYLEHQKWVRQHFELLPLDVEFRLWMGECLDP